MQVIGIVAVSDNGVIGNNNSIPWRQREDLKHFKKITAGSAMIMGRKTFESLPGVLPNRKHFVLTRNEACGITESDQVELMVNDGVPTRAFIIGLMLEIEEQGYEKVCIIGGAEIYKMCNDWIETFHVTEIHANIEGDTILDFDFNNYSTSDSEWHARDAENEHDYSFSVKYRLPF